jgi:CxxC-x17-CxxC domain-containing protein
VANDLTLQCRDCGRDFVFTAGEQEFFASRGFTNQPSRCPECRAAVKGSSGRGGGSSARGGDRQMYSAVCANCGQEARVPFQPSGDKPVYCSDCFQQMGGGSRGGDRGNRGGGSRGYGSSRD